MDSYCYRSRRFGWFNASTVTKCPLVFYLNFLFLQSTASVPHPPSTITSNGVLHAICPLWITTRWYFLTDPLQTHPHPTNTPPPSTMPTRIEAVISFALTITNRIEPNNRPSDIYQPDTELTNDVLSVTGPRTTPGNMVITQAFLLLYTNHMPYVCRSLSRAFSQY